MFCFKARSLRVSYKESYQNPPFQDKRRESGSLLSFELLHFRG